MVRARVDNVFRWCFLAHAEAMTKIRRGRVSKTSPENLLLEVSLLLGPFRGRTIPSSRASVMLRSPMPVKPEDECIAEPFLNQYLNGSVSLIPELSISPSFD